METSVSPDLSVAGSRVSDTVRTAMRSGVKGWFSSSFAMASLRGFERFLDREQIAPSHALGRRRAQEVSGVQRRHGARLVPTDIEVAPFAAHAHDAVRHVEEVLGRRA